MVLEVTNKRVIKFYEKNPSINFEAINLIFIDLFEKLLCDTNEKMNFSIQSQVLSAINDGAHNMVDIKSSISSLKDTLSSKLSDIKREYIEDIKSIVQANTHENITPVLDRHHSSLIDKTTLALHDVIPKNHTQIYSQIQEQFNSFKHNVAHQKVVFPQKSVTINSKFCSDRIKGFLLKINKLFFKSNSIGCQTPSTKRWYSLMPV
jgi:hypothetical protein